MRGNTLSTSLKRHARSAIRPAEDHKSSNRLRLGDNFAHLEIRLGRFAVHLTRHYRNLWPRNDP